jgi:FAD/FMN-containing dehydrogenase
MIDRRTMLKAAGGLALANLAGASVAAAPARATASGRTVPWDRLRSKLTGDLIQPGDSGYDLAKQNYIAAFDSANPQAIAYCQSAADVRATILFAQDYDVPMRTRSGGHNLCGWSTGSGLILDTSRFNQATGQGDTVHIGPGITSIDALTALQQYDKQIVTGACPGVCPGGFIPGGGIGFQTRKFGTGSDRLVSARMVLADGRIVRTSATEEPDLFWALRGGGGGNFGVILDFEVLPIGTPRGVYFNTVWSWDKAQELLEAWQEWSIASSHDFGSTMMVLLLDAAPDKTPVVILDGGYWGSQAELEKGLDDLAARAGTTPVTRVVQELSYHDVMQNAYGCGSLTVEECHRVGQTPAGRLARTGYLAQRNRIFNRPLAGKALSDTLAAFNADRRAGEERYVAFTATGGKANEVDRRATAYWHRDAQFVTIFSAHTDSATPPDDVKAAMAAWSDRGFALLDPESTGESYLNFPDMRLSGWQNAYYGGNYPRLVQVKNAYDPHDFFQHPRSIGA